MAVNLTNVLNGEDTVTVENIAKAIMYTMAQLDAGQLDDRYYTEVELDAGQLDSRYFTETEINLAVANRRKLYASESVTITPSADSDYTLTAGENLYGRLTLVDGSWTATHNIIVDTSIRKIIIDNTAGTYDATIKTSGGTGIIVGAGITLILYCDGINVIYVSGEIVCRVYRAGTLNAVALVSTKVPYDTVDFDSMALFNLANNRIIPKVAGYYSISTAIHAIAAAANGGLSSQIYKNGSSIASILNRTPSAVVLGSIVSTTVYCNGTTDYIEGYYFATGAGAITVDSISTYLTIEKV